MDSTRQFSPPGSQNTATTTSSPPLPPNPSRPQPTAPASVPPKSKASRNPRNTTTAKMKHAVASASAGGGTSSSPRGSVIYSAIYSGVPVYEMMCKDTPVMRRMADSYMNATQILKVAGFSKPRRTKILEREVLQGVHEKIQGGYGKYQGTWIPLVESKALAARYNVDKELRALFDFDPQTGSVAPKPSNMRSLLPERKQTPQSPSPPPGDFSLPNAIYTTSQPASGYNSRDETATPHTLSPTDPGGAQALSWEAAAGQLMGQLAASAADGAANPAAQTPEISAQVQSLMQHLLEAANVAAGHTAATGSADSPSTPVNPANGPEAEYYRKLQQGMVFDETAAHNYVANIQNILRRQDMQHYQHAQNYSSNPYLQPGAYPNPSVPAVQTAYQQLAMLNLLSMAAQHAYSAGYPNMEALLKQQQQGQQPKSTGGKSAEPATPASAPAAKTTGKSSSGAHAEARAAASSPEQARAPASSFHRRTTSTMEAAEPDSDPEAAERLSLLQARQRQVLSNLYLYGDGNLHEIIDSLKPNANSKRPDANMVVDGRKGSSLLHFAAALGRVKLVKALLRQGANPSITANGGETALMRTVCHVSCYDAQVFDQIADLLRDSVYLADNNRRTVFHHAARAARRRDLWVAAGYYVRILAHVLQEEYSEAPHLVPQVVNTQDTHGNTALHYACRSGNRNLTLTLLRLGANHELLNANGESPVDIARYDPRLLSMLFKEVDRDRTIGLPTPFDDLDEPDADTYMREPDEPERVPRDRDDEDSEYDDLERSPSPNPVERSMHEQTMLHLDSFYGERVEKILATLTPSVTGLVRAGVDHIRKKLLAQYQQQETKFEHTQHELVKAREQLEHAKLELTELQENRRRMDKLCVLASDLERRIEEHSEAAANRYRLAATAAAAAGAGGEDWEEEDEMGGAGGEKDRMDVEKAVDSSPPAAGGVEKESKVTEGSAETPSAAAKEESAAVADVAGGASSEALGSAAPNPCVEAAVDWTAASKDEAATGQLDAAVGKRKRSASPSPSDSASKHRRLTSPAPPPSDATVSAAAAAATSTGMRVTLDAPLLPRIDTLAALHPSALIASPPPAPTITPTMRSNRHYSMRLKTQLSNLESAVVRSETNRLLMRDEIDQVRLVRDEKDLKFKRIIAACLRCDVADVERLITPLVSEFEP